MTMVMIYDDADDDNDEEVCHHRHWAIMEELPCEGRDVNMFQWVASWACLVSPSALTRVCTTYFCHYTIIRSSDS